MKMKRLIISCSFALALIGCSSAYKVPVKAVATTVKVGTNTVKETVTLPVKVIKDSTKKQDKKDKK